MLGEGEKRQDNMDRIRRRTLSFLRHNQPDVDQNIARVLITYCFVSREDRKRVLLTWLSGQDIDEAEAKDLGLPTSWVRLDESSSENEGLLSRQQQKAPARVRPRPRVAVTVDSVGVTDYLREDVLALPPQERQRRLLELKCMTPFELMREHNIARNKRIFAPSMSLDDVLI